MPNRNAPPRAYAVVMTAQHPDADFVTSVSGASNPYYVPPKPRKPKLQYLCRIVSIQDTLQSADNVMQGLPPDVNGSSLDQGFSYAVLALDPKRHVLDGHDVYVRTEN